MIFGIGCDIAKISRIQKNIQNNRFMSKIYTTSEIDYIISKGDKASTAAGIFAAKEAFSKSICKGFVGFTFSDIEVIHNKDGAPIIEISDKVKQLIKKEISIHLSISHDEDYAIAYVISEVVI